MVLTAIEVDQWSGELDRLHARFTRSEPRRRARQYLSGLVAGLVGVVDRGQVRLSARFSTVTIMPKAAPASTTVTASTMTSPAGLPSFERGRGVAAR